MKRFLLALIAFGCLQAYGQINNGGFEFWQTIQLYEKLDDWRNTHDEEPGTLMMTKSTDAQHQTYSVRLETEIVGNDTTFGYVLLGDPEEMKGIPYAGTVSSMTGYYKCNIQAGDSAMVIAVGSLNGTAYPPQAKYFTGNVSTWTQFTMTFPVPVPVDSILVAAASNDPFNGSGITGSWIMFDNFVVNGGPGLPNQSFENWTPISYDKPDNWNTISAYTAAYFDAVTKSTDANSGNFAMSLETDTLGIWNNDTVRGMATNGNIDIWGGGGNPAFGGVIYVNQPSNFVGSYKYSPSGSDTAYAYIKFWNTGGLIDEKWAVITGTNTSYQQFNIPLNVTSTPDSMLVAVYSGNNPGSKLIIDDMDLTGGNVGIQDLNVVNSLSTFPNPASEVLNYTFTLADNSNVEVSLLDAQGRIVYKDNKGLMNSGRITDVININNLSAGIYVFNLSIEGNIYQHKIAVK